MRTFFVFFLIDEENMFGGVVVAERATFLANQRVLGDLKEWNSLIFPA